MIRLRFPNRGLFPGNKIPAIEQTLKLNYNIQKRKKSLAWGMVNICLASVFLFDLSYKCPLYTSWFHYFEYGAVLIFSLNTIYHFCRYLYFTIKTEYVTVTPTQKRLLGFKDTDTYCKLVDNQTPKQVETSNTTLDSTQLNWSAVSWRSGNTSNDSRNYSMSSPSWIYYRGSPERPNLNTTPPKVQFPDTSGIDFIDDERSLKQYLQDYEHYEKALNTSSTTEQTTNLLSTFWSHPATQNPNEVSPYLKKNQYQLSTQTAITNSASGKSDESGSPLNVSTSGLEVWHKLHIDTHMLIQWNANLRMWISQTILERIVKEIDTINNEFQKLHLNDVRIGSIGLERLRKTAQTASVIQYIPTLNALLPFLELTPNQEYLVKRIRELMKGGCMSEFKWNSGGSYNGKDWDDSLLTDSEIVMHLLSTYLDCQLLPLPNQPDAKPFSKEHYIRANDKVPHSPLTLAIHQVTEKPPHFQLIVGEEVLDLPKGHNNLFYTILLFLYYVNKKEHGMLGKVNMGRSGVNMLWIINSN